MLPFLTIRAVVVAALLVGLAPFVVNEVIRVNADKEARLEELHHAMLRSLNRTQQVFLEARREAERTVEVLAGFESLKAMPAPECTERLGRVLVRDQKIEQISLVSPAGVITCSTDPAAIGIVVSDRAYFTTALASDGNVWSGFFQSRLSGRVVSLIARSVRTGADVDYVIALLLDTDHLRRQSLDQFELPLTQAMLLDADGEILNGGAMPGVAAVLSAETRRRMAEIGTGLIEPGTYGAGDELVGVARLPDSTELTGFAISVEAVYREAARTVVSRLAVAALVTFGTAAVLLALLEWLVFRGLRQIVTVAGDVAAGAPLTRVAIRSPLPELVLLGRSINVMFDSLEASLNSDGLTGLHNRRALDAHMEASVRRHRRYGAGFTVVMVDVDHFKPFNDRYGHGVGDDVLRMIGTSMLPFARRPDEIAARYGGEEFALILTETDPVKVRRHLERLRQAVEALAIIHEAAPCGVVTVSIGFAVARPEDGAAAAFARADRSLYRAKAEGRNRVCDEIAGPAAPAASAGRPPAEASAA